MTVNIKPLGVQVDGIRLKTWSEIRSEAQYNSLHNLVSRHARQSGKANEIKAQPRSDLRSID